MVWCGLIISLGDCTLLRLCRVSIKAKRRGEETLNDDGFWMWGLHFNAFLPAPSWEQEKKKNHKKPERLNIPTLFLPSFKVAFYFISDFLVCMFLSWFSPVQFCLVSCLYSSVLFPKCLPPPFLFPSHGQAFMGSYTELHCNGVRSCAWVR